MKKLLILTIFMLLVQAGLSQAASIQTGQETNTLVIEKGKTHTLFLVINSPNSETLTREGEIGPWVNIEGSDSFQMPSGGTAIVEVNITVPSDTNIGTYKGSILSDGTHLASLEVTVTLSTSDIEELQTLSDVNQKISDLENRLESDIENQISEAMNDIQSRMDSMESEITGSIDTIRDYQSEIESLEAERVSLEDSLSSLNSEIDSLEAERSDLEAHNRELETTGNILRQESPVLFAVGLALGIGGMYLFYRKADKYFYRKPKRFLGR